MNDQPEKPTDTHNQSNTINESENSRAPETNKINKSPFIIVGLILIIFIIVGGVISYVVGSSQLAQETEDFDRSEAIAIVNNRPIMREDFENRLKNHEEWLADSLDQYGREFFEDMAKRDKEVFGKEIDHDSPAFEGDVAMGVLDDMINEILMFQEAEKLDLIPNDINIRKWIAASKDLESMSEKELKKAEEEARFFLGINNVHTHKNIAYGSQEYKEFIQDLRTRSTIEILK